MLDHFVQRDVAVDPPQGEGEAGARRGERLEAQGREDPCRPGVPRVGNDERITLVERPEPFGLRVLPIHPDEGYAEFRRPWASGSVSSFFSVLFSIWRIRSRVTPKAWPTSSSV